MLDVTIPDLTFHIVEYGRTETPWDLRVLLYKGGAKENVRTVFNQIAEGKLSRPLRERIELVKRIHEEMTAKLVGGGTKRTAFATFKDLRYFVAWVDEFDQPFALESVEDSFRHWCDYLHNRELLKAIKNVTACNKAMNVSIILDAVLERSQPLIGTTRLRKLKRGQRAVSVAADKQSLNDTFTFGQLCLDVIDSLPYQAIYGPLPAKVRLRDGRELELWSRLRDSAEVACLQAGYKNKNNTENTLRQRAAWEEDRTQRTRYPLINLRLIAEMMVFIGQTGMNFSQAQSLRLTQFSNKSCIDGYEVRDYKERRKGEVLFNIYTEYKDVFGDYLAWRDKIFGTSSDRLFPFIRQKGALETSPFDFRLLRDGLCKPMGIAFVSPRKLRSTRVNWLLRRSRDPELTAEQAQHSKETLLRVYEKPSLQVAQAEIIQFWKKTDPRLGGTLMPCPAPGSCDGVPEAILGMPPESPEPDCTNPSGCLFCAHHRDIDSEDYVWSTASMRYLNTIILPLFRPPAKGKADPAGHVQMALDVLTAKLKWFVDSNAKRKSWVDESMEKLAEGDYHVHWRYLIESAEAV